MTKSELIESIRAIVKEEVKTQLPNLIVELLTEKVSTKKSNITESRNTSTNTLQVPTRKSTPIINVKNPLLRSALSETIGGVPTDHGSIPIVSQAIISKELIAENKDVAAVDNAMKRDYRGLMKTMDRKRGTPSMNFQAQVPTSFDQDPI